ncbi:hypothetical protein HanXRQr2_Chr17g0795821 [Helianthus annuus]|uniref:Uncharacterized protein n=1 Tax=Helianthus annuus TaxID=4232 RepID=A0A9K3GU28_HELAN|nr:hypothetical protein HanXRQr2_Chr17g0795821 [Helianthus annuus]
MNLWVAGGGWLRVVLCGRATPSPRKRDDVTSPLSSDNLPLCEDDDRAILLSLSSKQPSCYYFDTVSVARNSHLLAS